MDLQKHNKKRSYGEKIQMLQLMNKKFPFKKNSAIFPSLRRAMGLYQKLASWAVFNNLCKESSFFRSIKGLHSAKSGERLALEIGNIFEFLLFDKMTELNPSQISTMIINKEVFLKDQNVRYVMITSQPELLDKTPTHLEGQRSSLQAEREMEFSFNSLHAPMNFKKNNPFELIQSQNMNNWSNILVAPIFRKIIHPTSIATYDNLSGLLPAPDFLKPVAAGFSPGSLQRGKNPTGNEWENITDTEDGNKLKNKWTFSIAQSEGTPLGIIPRMRMERFFPNFNLSGIRIHTDNAADEAARGLKADAFSTGRDLFFRKGSFNTTSTRGLALLGHELVHAQQTENGSRIPPFASRAYLEEEAFRVERTLSHEFTGNENQQNQNTNSFFSPVRMELAPTVSSSPLQGGDIFSTTGVQSMTSGTMLNSKGSFPLKAEEGRDIAPEKGKQGGDTSPRTGVADVEELSRQIYRNVERKITIEKERRGVDRWAF